MTWRAHKFCSDQRRPSVPPLSLGVGVVAGREEKLLIQWLLVAPPQGVYPSPALRAKTREATYSSYSEDQAQGDGRAFKQGRLTSPQYIFHQLAQAWGPRDTVCGLYLYLLPKDGSQGTSGTYEAEGLDWGHVTSFTGSPFSHQSLEGEEPIR